MGRKKITIEGNTISGTAEDITETLNQVTRKLSVNGTAERIQLKKAKIKDSLFLEVEYSETISDGTNTVKKDCTAPIHDDLKNAFEKLDHFLEVACEQDSACVCKGFSIGGSGDNEGVTLIGSRDVDMGVLNLVSPFIKWDSTFSGRVDLSEAIEACKHEVKLYLFEGKHKPEAQQELPFGEDISANQYDEEE